MAGPSMYTRLMETLTGGASRPQMSAETVAQLKDIGNRFSMDGGCSAMSSTDIAAAQKLADQPVGEKLRVGAEAPAVAQAAQCAAPK